MRRPPYVVCSSFFTPSDLEQKLISGDFIKVISFAINALLTPSASEKNNDLMGRGKDLVAIAQFAGNHSRGTTSQALKEI
jgi:hypothetical protein